MATQELAGRIDQASARPIPAIQEWQPRRGPSTGAILRNVTLVIFCITILFPIAWVLLLSVKSLPDAYQNEIWPTVFDFGHYAYSLQKIQTLPQNFWNSVMVTTGSSSAVLRTCLTTGTSTSSPNSMT